MKPVENSAAAKDRDLWSLGLLPVLLAGGVLALIGIYWDIAWHIDIGRDTFFTLPHNFLYTSIVIVLLVSGYGLWRDRRETPFHLRLGALRLHPGVLVIAVAAALELVFAPLDELWHQLFGPDVALWAPMHLVGLLAIGVANFGGLVASWVERSVTPDGGRRLLFSRVAIAYASLLLAWSMLLLAEFEYSIIQFPLILHPILLAALPSFVLVLVARLGLGRYAATSAALLFTGVRLVLAGLLMVTASYGLAGWSRPMIPVLLVSAVAVDLLTRKGTPSWAIGAVAALLGLGSNALLVVRGDGLAWPVGDLLLAIVPAVLLSSVLAGAGDWVAGALRGERQRKPVRLPVGTEGRA